MNSRRRKKNPEAVILETVAKPVEDAIEGMLVRMVNPGPTASLRRRGKAEHLRQLLVQGSQVLERLSGGDDYIREDGDACWQKLEVAYDSGVYADQRTALTCLQQKLMLWTAEDADVAGDPFVQQYRKELHLGLDH